MERVWLAGERRVMAKEWRYWLAGERRETATEEGGWGREGDGHRVTVSAAEAERDGGSVAGAKRDGGSVAECCSGECRCAWGTTRDVRTQTNTKKADNYKKRPKHKIEYKHRGTQKDNYRKRPKHKNTNKMTLRVVVVLCMVFEETVCGVVPHVATVHIACPTVPDGLSFAWKVFALTSTWLCIENVEC